MVPEYTYNPTVGLEYASILVPNIDNVRTDFLIHTVAKEGEVNLKKSIKFVSMIYYNHKILSM